MRRLNPDCPEADRNARAGFPRRAWLARSGGRLDLFRCAVRRNRRLPASMPGRVPMPGRAWSVSSSVPRRAGIRSMPLNTAGGVSQTSGKTGGAVLCRGPSGAPRPVFCRLSSAGGCPIKPTPGRQTCTLFACISFSLTQTLNAALTIRQAKTTLNWLFLCNFMHASRADVNHITTIRRGPKPAQELRKCKADSRFFEFSSERRMASAA